MGNDCYAGKAQQAQAYYYIENVKVEAITALSECKCGAADERDMDLVYGSSSNLPDDATPSSASRMRQASTTPSSSACQPLRKNTISEVVPLLNDNPNMNLEIVGHCDDDEFNRRQNQRPLQGIGKKRAGQVKRLIEAAGIAPHSADRQRTARTRTLPALATAKLRGPRTAA